MGLFLDIIGTKKSARETTDVIANLVASGKFETFIFYCHEEPETHNTTVFFGAHDHFYGHSHLAADLSKDMLSPTLLLHIHDGDLWMYELFSNGACVDRHNPIPDYWAKISQTEKRSWKGDAKTFASAWGKIQPESVASYLVFHEDINTETKAYHGDSFEYWNPWQMLDFIKKIGLGYADGPETAFLDDYSEGENVPEYDRRGKNGYTPLLKALGSYEEVKYLLDKGANPNKGDLGRETPLFKLAEHIDDKDIDTHIKIAAALLAKGADPNLKNIYGWSPLLICAMFKNLKMAKWLIRHGADINIEDTSGDTALTLAIRRCYFRTALILFINGASPYAGKNILNAARGISPWWNPLRPLIIVVSAIFLFLVSLAKRPVAYKNQ